jgi:CO/xanthine dehydrogenase Mo-binding subunit
MSEDGRLSEALRGARYLGRSLERREDDRLLTGRQQYLDDVTVPGALEAALVRSPFAHTRIRSIDASAALALAGVHLVITGEQLVEETDPMAQIIAGYSQYPLAVGKVRYEGEPVAFVVADDRYIAEDATELVKVDYEPLPVVADRDAARRRAGDRLAPELRRAARHEWRDRDLRGRRPLHDSCEPADPARVQRDHRGLAANELEQASDRRPANGRQLRDEDEQLPLANRLRARCTPNRSPGQVQGDDGRAARAGRVSRL